MSKWPLAQAKESGVSPALLTEPVHRAIKICFTIPSRKYAHPFLQEVYAFWGLGVNSRMATFTRIYAHPRPQTEAYTLWLLLVFFFQYIVYEHFINNDVIIISLMHEYMIEHEIKAMNMKKWTLTPFVACQM